MALYFAPSQIKELSAKRNTRTACGITTAWLLYHSVAAQILVLPDLYFKNHFQNQLNHKFGVDPGKEQGT
jgi:hypothetical protein